MICWPLDNTSYTAKGLGAYNATRTRGVFSADDNFGITYSGRTITIGTGLAWLKMSQFWGVSALLDTQKQFTLDAGDGLLGRTDIVVVRLDKELNAATVLVRKGTPASTPVYIAPVRDDTADELYLYAISIPAGCTEISSANITSLMNDETLCGVMRDGVTGIPTAQIQAQATALINDLQTQIDGIVTTNDHMLKPTYDTNNDGRVNAADDATNGIRLYTWANGALTGAGENGKFYYPADATATTVSSITINSTGHSVAQGENDSITLLPGTWYTFTLDAEQYTINFSVGSSKYSKFVMALSTVGDASYWTLTGDKSATAGYYVSTYTGAVDEFIINGVTHAVSAQNDSAVDLVEGNVYTFVLTNGDDSEQSDLSNVTALETVSGGVSPIITVQTVSRDEMYLKIVDITGTTITDNIVGASAYEQAVGGGYEGDKDSFETALAELPSALQEQTDARTDFAGTAQTNLNERINSDVAMLLDRFNAATSVPYEGEFINASNTYLGTMRETKIKGKTYQNLVRLDLPASELFGDTFGGTLTDGKITVTGDGANFKNEFYKYNLQMFKPSTNYTIVLNVTSNTLVATANVLTDHNASNTSVFSDTINFPTTTGTFKYLATTVDTIDDSIHSVLRSILTNTETGSITYSFQILEGDYTSTDLPSTITGIESVSGELVETSCGKNLLNNKNYYATQGAFFLLFRDVYLLSGQQYTLKYYENTFAYSDTGLKILVVDNQSTQDENSVQIIANWFDGLIGINLNRSFIFEGKTGLYSICFYAQNIGELYLAGDGNIQLEIGETATDYEPYIADTQTFEDITLHSLPDGTCDYIDKQNDCWVQNVGFATISGSDGIAWAKENAYQDYNYWYKNGLLQNPTFIIGRTPNCFCNKIPVFFSEGDFTSSPYISAAWGTQITIATPLGVVDTSDELNSFLGTDTITLYYPLATPITHPLPCRELKSYDGTTNVYVSGSNIPPTTATRIPSDTAAMVASLQAENAALTNQLEDTTNAILAQGGNNV